MKSPGQVAFEAYNAAKGGVTYDGKPIPPWSDVGDAVRSAWEAAAVAVQQPLSREYVVAVLEQIVRNDTTAYDHHEPRRWDGLTPEEAGTGGTRWLAPNEIARSVLRRIGAPVPDPIAELRSRIAKESSS